MDYCHLLVSFTSFHQCLSQLISPGSQVSLCGAEPWPRSCWKVFNNSAASCMKHRFLTLVFEIFHHMALTNLCSTTFSISHPRLWPNSSSPTCPSSLDCLPFLKILPLPGMPYLSSLSVEVLPNFKELSHTPTSLWGFSWSSHWVLSLLVFSPMVIGSYFPYCSLFAFPYTYLMLISHKLIEFQSWKPHTSSHLPPCNLTTLESLRTRWLLRSQPGSLHTLSEIRVTNWNTGVLPVFTDLLVCLLTRSFDNLSIPHPRLSNAIFCLLDGIFPSFPLDFAQTPPNPLPTPRLACKPLLLHRTGQPGCTRWCVSVPDFWLYARPLPPHPALPSWILRYGRVVVGQSRESRSEIPKEEQKRQ